MFSQFDNAEVEDYFNRLNAQLNKMPEADRAELHQEVRQHLAALAAAQEADGASPAEATRSAMSRFGDPAEVGRRMMREWRLTMNKTRASLWRLIFFVGLAQAALASLFYVLEFAGPHLLLAWWSKIWSSVWLPNDSPHTAFFTLWYSALNLLMASLPIVAGAVIGVKKPTQVRPEQAIPIAFYTGVISWPITVMIYGLYYTSVLHHHIQLSFNLFYFNETDVIKLVMLECLAAYAASLYTQSGGRRLRLADWTLRVG